MANDVVGMHPTGMHSCFKLYQLVPLVPQHLFPQIKDKEINDETFKIIFGFF